MTLSEIRYLLFTNQVEENGKVHDAHSGATPAHLGSLDRVPTNGRTGMDSTTSGDRQDGSVTSRQF